VPHISLVGALWLNGSLLNPGTVHDRMPDDPRAEQGVPAALAQQGAVTAERGRILQEMHDGMGAHLTAALHLARRGEVARHELIGSIEESLQDLRSIIDSLDLSGGDLLPLLANLRFRLEPRLKTLGVELRIPLVLASPAM
jgi:signal transduction histidine kinase